MSRLLRIRDGSKIVSHNAGTVAFAKVPGRHLGHARQALVNREWPGLACVPVQEFEADAREAA
jgi:hypothetical protein